MSATKNEAEKVGKAVTRLIEARAEFIAAWVAVATCGEFNHYFAEDEAAYLVALMEKQYQEARAERPALPALPAPADLLDTVRS